MKMMKKRGAALLLAACVLLTVSLAGCGGEKTVVTSQNHGDASALSLPVDSSGKARLRIGTYNVKNLTNGENAARIGQQIQDAALDVVCVQEMDVNTDRAKGQDLLKALSEASRLPFYHFYQAMALQGGGYGLAILSKYPLSDCKTIALETSKKEEPRIVAQAVVRTSAGPITVNNTHLSFESTQTRVKQFAFLNEQLSPTRNSLLMGDFNVESFSEFDALTGFTAVNTQASPYRTYRGDDAAFLSLDNLLYTGTILVNSSQMVDSDASDHNMLWADLTVSLADA